MSLDSGLDRVRKARIWCITGYKGVGKDAVGDMLVKMDWVAHQFIDPAYKAVAAAYNIPFEMLKQAPFKDTPQSRLGHKTPRQLVAGMCDYIRQQSPTAMVDLWLEAVGDEQYKRIVATGLRMADEVAAVQAQGAAIIRIDRPGYGPYDKYDADIDAITPDWVIVNDGNLYDLRQRVHHAMGLEIPPPHPLL